MEDLKDYLKALDSRVMALEKQTMPENRDELKFQLNDLDTRMKQNQEQMRLLESAVLEMFRGKGNASQRKSRASQIISQARNPSSEDGGIEMKNMLTLSGERKSSAPMRISSFDDRSFLGQSFDEVYSFASSLKFKTDKRSMPESPYEAIVFFPQQSRKAGITTIASLVISFMLQFVLLNSFKIMNDGKLGSVAPEDARIWRNGAGHRETYSSILTGASLVSRVCVGDNSVHMSSNVLGLLGEIDQFLEQGTAASLWFPERFGVMLAMAITTLWSMQAMQELGTVFNFLFFLFSLPSGSTQFGQDEDNKENLDIASIGHCMRGVAISACCVHLAIDAVAWYLGCVYIVRTIETENIVINGLGAALMISVDKVVFSSLVADQVKKDVGNFRFTGFRGTFVNKICLMSIMAAAMVMVELRPLAIDMEKYKAEACGGKRNFTIGIATKTLIFAAAESPDPGVNTDWTVPDDSEPDPFGFGHFKYAVKAAVDGEKLSKTLIHWLPSKRNLNLFLNMGLQEMRDEFDTYCHDFNLLEFPKPFLTSIRRQVGLPRARSCEDFAQFKMGELPACHKKANRLLRTFCPISCRCDEPASGLLYRAGCPESCTHTRLRKAKEHELLKYTQGGEGLCSNFVPKILASNQGWSLYVTSLRFKWISFFKGYPCFDEGMEQYLPALSLGECPLSRAKDGDGFHHWDITRTLCSIPSFAFWCPDSCKCKEECSGNRVWRCNKDCNPICHSLPPPPPPPPPVD